MCAQQRLRSAWASIQSDQSLRCPHEESLGPPLPIERTAKTLIRLGGCTATLLVLSWGGSIIIFIDIIVHFRSRRKENDSEIPAHGIYRNVKRFLQPFKLREISIMIRSWNYLLIKRTCTYQIHKFCFSARKHCRDHIHRSRHRTTSWPSNSSHRSHTHCRYTGHLKHNIINSTTNFVKPPRCARIGPKIPDWMSWDLAGREK